MHARGFTLIEILLVVAIIGILAAIGIPAYQKYRLKAYDAAASSDLHHLATFEQQFYNEHGLFVSLAPGDKQASGLIRKTVALPDGSSALFEVRVLTPQLEIVANTDTMQQACTIGAHHDAGTKVFAMELEQNNAIYFRDFPPTQQLTQADLPAATSRIDLTSPWKPYAQR